MRQTCESRFWARRPIGCQLPHTRSRPTVRAVGAMPTVHKPFSQKARTPTVAKEFQIGLFDPAADLEHFWDSCSAGFFRERLYNAFFSRFSPYTVLTLGHAVVTTARPNVGHAVAAVVATPWPKFGHVVAKIWPRVVSVWPRGGQYLATRRPVFGHAVANIGSCRCGRRDTRRLVTTRGSRCSPS